MGEKTYGSLTGTNDGEFATAADEDYEGPADGTEGSGDVGVEARGD